MINILIIFSLGISRKSQFVVRIKDIALNVVFVFFFPLSARWFCHFDDDNYVNVPALVNTLKNFNPEDDVYLGKPSLIREMEVKLLVCGC